MLIIWYFFYEISRTLELTRAQKWVKKSPSVIFSVSGSKKIATLLGNLPNPWNTWFLTTWGMIRAKTPQHLPKTPFKTPFLSILNKTLIVSELSHYPPRFKPLRIASIPSPWATTHTNTVYSTQNQGNYFRNLNNAKRARWPPIQAASIIDKNRRMSPAHIKYPPL